MTQEDKELLLKDLCARLPYGLKVKCENYPLPATVLYAGNIDEVKFRETGGIENIYTIKPYLFPLSSMTEEQIYNNPIGFCQMTTILANRDWERITIEHTGLCKLIDWFNKNHFDYRGLIPKDLAIDATGLNIY